MPDRTDTKNSKGHFEVHRPAVNLRNANASGIYE